MQNGIFAPPSGGFTGATPHRDGQPGPVPAPKAGDQDLMMHGDGRWRAANGGATTQTMSADLYLTPQSARVQRLSPSTGGLAVFLGNATAYSRAGGPVHIIHNDQSTHPLSIYGASGVPLAQLRPGQVAFCNLTDQSSPAGAWMMVVEDRWTGCLYSQRQVLAAHGAYNVRLSAASALGKALLSYVVSGGVKVRVLTISGRTATAGAEQGLGGLSGLQAGHAVLLSDTTGIFVYRDNAANQVRAWGFSVDLATGTCTAVGSPLNLAANANDLVISVARIDSQRAIAQWSRTDVDNSLTWCMVRFDGSTTTAGAVSAGSFGSTLAAETHDIVVLSTTSALSIYAAYSGSAATVREIALNTATLAVTPGSASTSSTAYSVNAARVDSTYAVIMTQQYSSWPAQSRLAKASGIIFAAEAQVSSSAGVPCAILCWGDGGVYFVREPIGGSLSLAAVEYRLNGEFSPVFDRAQARLLSAAGVPGNTINIRALALTSSLGLLVYCDPGNSSWLTAIVIERVS